MMQNKRPGTLKELKKSICKNYLIDACPYGKSCRFRHPPQKEIEPEVCKYFLQDKCKRGSECPFLHKKTKREKGQRSDWLTFCLYFPTGHCKNVECRFLHIKEEDKNVFRKTGKIGPHLLDQAMCKALLQDVSLNGTTPTCQDYLQGSCEWMSCPLLHLTTDEYSAAILGLLREKFEAVLGSHVPPKIGYNSTPRHHESHGYEAMSSFGFNGQPKHESYLPVRANEAFGSEYGRKPAWDDRGYESHNDVSPDTDRIIKGIYNLMKADGTLIRSDERSGGADLRSKLNRLTDENPNNRSEFSSRSMYQREGYKPLLPSTPLGEDIKYQDTVLRLEKENLEMKKQLLMLQEKEQHSFQSGRFGMFQGNSSRGGIEDHSHLPFDGRLYGLPKPGPTQSMPFSPLKEKINAQLKQNMYHQYNKSSQMKQRPFQQPMLKQPSYPLGKMYYPKYQKYPQASKKTPQQPKKVHANSKGENQVPKKKSSSPSSSSSKTKSTDTSELDLNKEDKTGKDEATNEVAKGTDEKGGEGGEPSALNGMTSECTSNLLGLLKEEDLTGDAKDHPAVVTNDSEGIPVNITEGSKSVKNITTTGPEETSFEERNGHETDSKNQNGEVTNTSQEAKIEEVVNED